MSTGVWVRPDVWVSTVAWTCLEAWGSTDACVGRVMAKKEPSRKRARGQYPSVSQSEAALHLQAKVRLATYVEALAACGHRRALSACCLGLARSAQCNPLLLLQPGLASLKPEQHHHSSISPPHHVTTPSAPHHAITTTTIRATSTKQHAPRTNLLALRLVPTLRQHNSMTSSSLVEICASTICRTPRRVCR